MEGLMIAISVTIDEIELDGDGGGGGVIPGLLLTCDKCGHTVEVYGTSGVSARRGAIMLRDECPDGDDNFYVVEEYGG
jgi:hypothetical protein